MIESSELIHIKPEARLFSDLTPWRPAGSGMEEQLIEISRLCAEEVSTASASDSGLDNRSLPAAYAGLWALIDNDLRSESALSASVDLNSVYGQLAPLAVDDSPVTNRFSLFSDPRDRDRLSVDADSPSDEETGHAMVDALHHAILSGHHELGAIGDSFDEAKRQITWRYQWVVVHDFLNRLCGERVVDQILDEAVQRKNLRARDAFGSFQTPAEFTKAAFRLGMTIARPVTGLESWSELLGEAGIDSRYCFRFGPHTVESDIHDELQLKPEFNSPSFLMLLSSWDANLPSGQEVARALGIRELPGNDPLWLYILKEAADQNDGVALGELGATLVARVIIDALVADPDSFLNADTEWRPASRDPGSPYGLREFLQDCGADLDDAIGA